MPPLRRDAMLLPAPCHYYDTLSPADVLIIAAIIFMTCYALITMPADALADASMTLLRLHIAFDAISFFSSAAPSSSSHFDIFFHFEAFFRRYC